MEQDTRLAFFDQRSDRPGPSRGKLRELPDLHHHHRHVDDSQPWSRSSATADPHTHSTEPITVG